MKTISWKMRKIPCWAGDNCYVGGELSVDFITSQLMWTIAKID